MTEVRARTRRSQPRAARDLTRASLERAALAYLERYDSSEANLRAVLRRRVARASAADPDGAVSQRDAIGWVDEIVDRLAAQRLVDDRRYAEALARKLARRSCSHGATLAKLRSKGVDAALAREVAGERADPDSELAAAAAYARRRRLGPFRSSPEAREELRERDLGALARRGFELDVARRVVDARSADELPEPRSRLAFD